jgi:hypothetical protein
MQLAGWMTTAIRGIRSGDNPMKHPERSDFDTFVTEEGVRVTFNQTNSIYNFYMLTDPKNIARVGPVSFAGVQHRGCGTGGYASDEVQDMARSIAAEFAQSFRSPLDEALAAIRFETKADNVTRIRPISLASIPGRVASEVDTTLGLIQNLYETDDQAEGCEVRGSSIEEENSTID